MKYATIVIVPDRLPPRSFLLTLSPDDCVKVFRACLLVYSQTRGKIVPLQGQLEASLASMSGRDSFVIARTGYGKTLCIAIPLLLEPNSVTLTISPLKRLQTMQVQDFIRKYGIPTVAINEDTPSSPELWKRIQDGKIQHLIVQPEQFRLTNGHLPRIARLLHDRAFVSKISRVSVDEAHNIKTAGTVINGRPAFRPAWGGLGEVRARLPKTTSWQALSATIPSFIHRTIRQSLGFMPDALSIKVSINRQNLIYASHKLVDGCANYRNLDCIIPQPFHPPMRLPKLVIFHGKKAETSNYAQYLNSRLPPSFQKLRICRHYHSDMSPEYLQQTYDDFANADGSVLILHATSGAGEGLDVAEIDGVILMGLPDNLTLVFQWLGRGGRSSTRDAFGIMMIEPWVFDMDLSNIKKNPRKQERIGTACVRLATCTGCKRSAFAKFFEDDSDEALDFTCRWCCDGHPGDGFSLAHLFLGPIYEGEEARASTKRKRTKYRPVKQRPGLLELLTIWLDEVHEKDELRFVRPRSLILDDSALKSLSMADPSTISSPESIVYILQQSDEWKRAWANAIFDIIRKYDGKLPPRTNLDSNEVAEEDEDEGTEWRSKRLAT
ncbi:P-loop containing nucleoside triphosphate hydrolase protein [Mycena galopus ATCC 62051]|nr:P-loop containing nucleoside triphosphate hydrolase protein [Mycena galopus ATCC 62051]